MEAIFSNENQRLTVSLIGRLDSSNVRDLESKLKEKLAGVEEVIFDFAKLEYLSSAGLRVLLASHKLLHGNMKILHVNDLVLDIFNVTGMSTIFNIE